MHAKKYIPTTPKVGLMPRILHNDLSVVDVVRPPLARIQFALHAAWDGDLDRLV